MDIPARFFWTFDEVDYICTSLLLLFFPSELIIDEKKNDCMVFVASLSGRDRMMTMGEFQKLGKDEQIAVLYDQGVFLGKRREMKQAVLLFQFESFYVEVFYKVYRQYVSKIKLSGNTSILDPYLEQIDVEDLVNEL